MKRTSFALLVVGGVGFFSLAAGAAPTGLPAELRADLTLRPGVSGHAPVQPAGLYGAFDATYDAAAGTLVYSLRYKGLQGSAFRVVIRSRSTGATFAVLCSFCTSTVRAAPGREGLQVRHISGSVTLDPDIGFLITHGRSFVQVDTTAYASGEIGGRITARPPELPFTGPGPPKVQSSPRCC